MPPLPKSGKSKCIGIKTAALHTILHFSVIKTEKFTVYYYKGQ